VLLFAGGSFVSAKNTMVQKNEDVDAAYAQVQVQQQRRMDLIPNLVASVKGYVAEESTVLTNIANARAAVMGATDRSSSIQANQKLDLAISPLLRLQEAYPNLKSNEQFRTLTDELAGTENRIAAAVRSDAAGLQRIHPAVSAELLGGVHAVPVPE
jgi:LemA protein